MTFAEDGAQKVKVTGPVGPQPANAAIAVTPAVDSSTNVQNETLAVLKRIDEKLGFLIEVTTGAKLC